MRRVIDVNDLRKKKVSFLFVTAAEVEKEAVLKAMRPLKGEETLITAIGKNTTYDVGLFGQYLIAHVLCENQGSIKEGGAILTTQEALNEVMPKACLMIGIAYGANEQRQSIGDILISKYVQPYESIRISTSEEGCVYEEDRNGGKSPGRIIINSFTNFDFPDKKYKIWKGTILSGEKLIDNKEYKRKLMERFEICNQNRNNEIIGGEMEGVGLASTLTHNGNENWIIVKAICDWADGNKKENKEKRQQLAAENAVDFCKKIFKTDILTHISGVKKYRTKKNSESLEIINPFVLFYYRNKKMLSFRKLEEKTKISEEELRKYENYTEEEGKQKFCEISSSNVIKIKNALGCNEIISNENTPEEMQNFYRKHKGKGRFLPTRNSKVVIFDFDGTITKTENNYSTWQMIWLYLGYSLNDCGRFYRKFINKEISHQEWCDITAEYFIKRNLSIENIEDISRKISLVDGTIETIKEIKAKGVKVYICSGSIDEVIEKVLGENVQLFDGIACNKFTYDKSGKLKSIVGTKFDFEGKAKYIKSIIENQKITPEECLFVGNSDNDEFAYESGAKTLVVNPNKTSGMCRKIWKYYLEEMNNLEEILPYIFPQDS